MLPIDEEVYYGICERRSLDSPGVQLELIPDKLHSLRSKLHQKAKNEPNFRFYTLYDRVYRWDVLEAAWKHVGKRRKAAGIDGVRAEDILEQEHGVQNFLQQIQDELRQKSYRPSPVRRVYIEKPDGGQRPLGIPTLKDRVVQMALKLIIEPIFEADFHDCSYGYREGRGAKDALQEIRQNIKKGFNEVYDADLKGYFDNIPHDKLMACVRKRITDRNVLRLLRGWLETPVIETDGQGKKQPPQKSDKGTPQGGVISPLLANLYLHWFDELFHRKGGPHTWAKAKLIRYADDFVVMARYQGPRIAPWIERTLEDWMGLEINRQKTKVVKLKEDEKLDFVGYTFRYDRDLHGRDHKYLNVLPSKKSQKRARTKLRELTGPRRRSRPIPELIGEVNRFLLGWRNYFNFGYPKKTFKDVSHYSDLRMENHLKRRSQRGYHWPKNITYYRHLRDLGLLQL